MACTGYSPKAVKVNKSAKRIAATILDAHERGEFIRRYVTTIRDNANFKSSRNKKDEN